MSYSSDLNGYRPVVFETDRSMKVDIRLDLEDSWTVLYLARITGSHQCVLGGDNNFLMGWWNENGGGDKLHMNGWVSYPSQTWDLGWALYATTFSKTGSVSFYRNGALLVSRPYETWMTGPLNLVWCVNAV